MRPPSFPYRRWLRRFVAIASVATVVASWILGGHLTAPANRSVGDPPKCLPMAETVSIQDAQSGRQLSGWFIDTPGARATVLLLHPIRADRRSMTTRAELLINHGYAILIDD